MVHFNTLYERRVYPNFQNVLLLHGTGPVIFLLLSGSPDTQCLFLFSLKKYDTLFIWYELQAINENNLRTISLHTARLPFIDSKRG